MPRANIGCIIIGGDLLLNLVIFEGFGDVLLEVLLALTPLVIAFLIFQVFFLKLPKDKIINLIKGIILSFIGLSLFLQGVQVGFLPVGQAIGEALGSKPYNWILIPIGFILGFVITLAEPTVRILNLEVEKVSSGYVRRQFMLYTLSIGVGTAVAISMARILIGFPLWYIILPGYLIAFILIYYTKHTFVSIAFDSGGAATGPLTVTFIMAIAIGVASSIPGRNPLLDGFGMTALVVLAPIIAVLLLGVLYNKKEKKEEEMQMDGNIQFDLIVTIVNKGYSEKVVEASKKAGAEGGTIIFGRGTGIHEKAKLFGITIEPEKELVLTLIKRELTQTVLDAIVAKADLYKPGKGISFVLEVGKVVGISHLLEK
jgi:nitrogen regulatory protein PII